MNIGVYVRPWNEEFYVKLAKLTFENSNIISLSEFKGVGDIWIGSALYKDEPREHIFNTEEMMDIYLRCRFLRSLDIEKAFILINKMASYIDSLFRRNRFEYFIGHLIDNYTLDIIERISRRYGVKYISLVGHFINGYSRISSRGELNVVRGDITEEEITSVLNSLIDINYKPKFELNKKKTKKEGVLYYCRAKAKKICFSINKVIRSDVLNYHYNTYGFKDIKLKDVINEDIEKLFCNIDDLCLDKNSVYLPLHYTPEATVDYWCDLPKHSFYKESLLDFISNSSNEINFVLKEHPAMYMKRDISFYKVLLSFNNVKVVHPYENSNLLLEKIDNVFVYTGSVGVEALLRGKNVFSITENYYTNLHPNIKIRFNLQLDDLEQGAESYDNRVFIESLLKGLMPARFINSKRIMDSDIELLSLYIKRSL